MDGADLASVGADLPIVGVVFAVIAVLLVVVAAFVFIIPALVFVIELVVVLGLVGLGVLGRVLLGRPWTVQARTSGADHAYEWKCRGWSASGELVETIARQLHATGRPTSGTRFPPDPR